MKQPFPFLMEDHTERYRKIEQVVDTYPRLEAINAEQIREAETPHGRSKSRQQVREESWSARERSKGFQSSGQRKRQARLKRLKEKQ